MSATPSSRRWTSYAVLATLAACGHHAAAPRSQAPSPVANQAARSLAGELVLAAGGTVTIDQVFIWALWDREERVHWIHTLLLGDGAAPRTCAQVWPAGAPDAAAPFRLEIWETHLEDDGPETTAGWSAGARATGRVELIAGEDELHVGSVDVRARHGGRWIVDIELARNHNEEEDVRIAAGRFDAHWCGVVAELPIDPEGD